MPLDRNEQEILLKRIAGVIGGFNHTEAQTTPNDAMLNATERLLDGMARLTDLASTILERAIGEETGAPAPAPGTIAGPADAKPKNRGGRPKKAAADAPADPPPSGNGAASDADDMFGNPHAGHDDDPLALPGDKAPAEKPADKPLTDVQVKDVLRTYMQAYGNEGTARLTDLLTRVAGVKRFSDLTPDKYHAAVAAAQKEMAGK